MAGLKGLLGATVALTILTQQASAGEAQDRLFAVGALKEVETGETLVYDFSRQGAYTDDKLPKVTNGVARLSLVAETEGKRSAVALLRDDKNLIANFDPFPGDAGNPVFMIFMEEAVASMAKLTGGSSFYIRNRMREALGAQNVVEEVTVPYDGREVPARTLTFQPFLNDKNAAKMGEAFQRLTITFVMSDEIPGEFVRMEAVAGPEGSPEGAAGANSAPFLDMTFRLAKIEES